MIFPPKPGSYFNFQIWLRVDQEEGLYKLLIGTDALSVFKEEAAKNIRKHGEDKLLFCQRLRLDVKTSVEIVS